MSAASAYLQQLESGGDTDGKAKDKDKGTPSKDKDKAAKDKDKDKAKDKDKPKDADKDGKSDDGMMRHNSGRQPVPPSSSSRQPPSADDFEVVHHTVVGEVDDKQFVEEMFEWQRYGISGWSLSRFPSCLSSCRRLTDLFGWV
jgi:hypothetical protein